MKLLPFLVLAACISAGDVFKHPPGFVAEGDTGAEATGIQILSPTEQEVADNPVTFRWQAHDPAIVTATFTCEDYPLHEDPLQVTGQVQTFTRDFSGTNYLRDVVLVGWDDQGEEVARDRVQFIPAEGWLPDEAGFNHYVVEAMNDGLLYPKDGTWPYCWEAYGETCGENWGMIWGASYVGVDLFPGGEDCFCSGHTLEIFLDAYTRWQADHEAVETDPYGGLTLDDVDLGDFYQHWQGYGAGGGIASAANAFEYAGIGEELDEADWPTATTGDFVNLSRSTGSGHSVIFVDWIWEGDDIAGIRYYGCNGGGDSHPFEDDPDLVEGVSGPSFVTEMFEGHGGTVLPSYLFIGHPYDPGDL